MSPEELPYFRYPRYKVDVVRSLELGFESEHAGSDEISEVRGEHSH
jgi:hypothetical protein